MQTFLPYEDFYESAKVLDNKRLGKQRVECLQIFNAITKDTGWRHHPIINMWRDSENWLYEYTRVICTTWIKKGYKDTVWDQVSSQYSQYRNLYPENKPIWLGNFWLHRSHQSNLYRKDPIFYNQFSDIPAVPYTWYSDKKGFYLGEFNAWNTVNT
tara:strand:- start:982 stop:1449 length:468 start_codon:yes stop_codon:yes gene_type:complete